MELRLRHDAYHLAKTLLLCLALSSAEANYVLEILIEGYQNPSHMSQEMASFRHGCCDGDASLPCEPCENVFSVCVRETPTGALTHTDCHLEVDSTEIPDDDDGDSDTDDLTFVMGEDIAGIPNPFNVSGDMWTGTVEILFTIYDLDGTSAISDNSDVVDQIFIYPDIDAVPSNNDPFSEAMTYIGRSNFSHLQLAFRLTCGADSYGPSCTRCIPSNDSSTGYYTCDGTTGERLCLEGYQNPGNLCLDCIPADNCSAEGGYCEEPDECRCRAGYSGQDCGDSVCDVQPCSTMGTCTINASSVLNYTCLCQEGTGGVNCNITLEQCSPACQNGDCENNSCVCVAGYTGPDCGEVVEVCDVECGENGRCVKGEEGGSGGMCECEEGYTGPFCEEEICDVECGENGRCVKGEEGGSGGMCECEEGYTGPFCEEEICDVECGENGRCVKGEEGEDDKCECEEGYTGELCSTTSATGDGGGNNGLLVIVVAVIGAVLAILITAVLIAFCVLLCRGRKLRRKDDGQIPSPYETPFFRRWLGNGHMPNNPPERKFENPLYHETGGISPTSPPLPPRPDHPYATLEDINNPYAQIPADYDVSLDEKPAATVANGDVMETAAPSHQHICPPLPSLEAASSPRSENPYMSPVNSLNPSRQDNPMNSSTVLYAHIQ